MTPGDFHTIPADDPRLTWWNAAELRPLGDGFRVQRVPDSWRLRFPSGAAARAIQSANVVCRFAAPTGCLRLHWRNAYLPTPDYFPCRGQVLCNGVEVERFSVARTSENLIECAGGGLWEIHFPWMAAVHLRGIEMERDVVPSPAPLPEAPRWLCYGDSITQGFNATLATGTWPWLAAQGLGWNVLNLGFGGAAFGEAVVAEYIADRSDWDRLTLAFGINNAANGHSSARVAATYDTFLEILRRRHPDTPILCITPILCTRPDLYEGPSPSGEPTQRFRDAIADVVLRRGGSDPHLHLLDGLTCLPGPEMLDDQVHPNDAGMRAYADRVVRAWRAAGV